MVCRLILVLVLSGLLVSWHPADMSQAQGRAPGRGTGAQAPPVPAPGDVTPLLRVEALHLVSEGKEGEKHMLLMDGVGGRTYGEKPTFDLITGPIRGKRFIPRATTATVNAECKVPLGGPNATQSIRLTIAAPGPRCDALTMLAPSGPEGNDSEGLMLRIHVKAATGYPLKWPNEKFSKQGLPWPTRTPEGDTLNLYQLLWAEDLKQWLLVGAMKPYPTE